MHRILFDLFLSLWLLTTQIQHTQGFVGCRGEICHGYRRQSKILSRLKAASPRDIKIQNKQNKRQNSVKKAGAKKPKTLAELSVSVKRLAREMAEKRKLEASKSTPEPVTEKPLGNLKTLFDVIDRRLNQENSLSLYDGNRGRKSVESLLEHNYDKWKRIPDEANELCSVRNVAVVFGKVLVNDQITMEYAARLRTLARLILDGELKPSLICFCGGVSRGNNLSSGDVGYMFFKQLCLSEGISLDDTKIYVDRSSLHEGKLLQNVANHIKKGYLSQWLSVSHETESLTDVYGMARSAPRKKVRVHFTLVSTDYHLCNLNDLHQLSPDQSLLRPILYLSNEKTMQRYHERESETFSSKVANRKQSASINGIVSTSWSYRYSTYPFLYARDETTTFMGQCYLLGEKLVPLMYNLGAVVDDREFFQRGNFMTLASIRHELVRHVEGLYKTSPGLRSGLRQLSGRNGEETVDAVLEGALLSLGRCVDIVRPGGLHVGSVSKSDYKRALRALDHCMVQIRSYCDPDRPIDISEWGTWGSEDTDTTLEQADEEDHPVAITRDNILEQ